MRRYGQSAGTREGGGSGAEDDDELLVMGTVLVFRQEFTLEDAIGSHACSREANMRVTNGIPLGRSLLLPVGTVICVQTLKATVASTAVLVMATVLSAAMAAMQMQMGCQEGPVQSARTRVRGTTPMTWHCWMQSQESPGRLTLVPLALWPILLLA
jgi:hypothetical protein